MQSYDKLVEKWAPVLNEESAGAITDHHRKAVTAAILENQERQEILFFIFQKILSSSPASYTCSHPCYAF